MMRGICILPPPAVVALMAYCNDRLCAAPWGSTPSLQLRAGWGWLVDPLPPFLEDLWYCYCRLILWCPRVWRPRLFIVSRVAASGQGSFAGDQTTVVLLLSKYTQQLIFRDIQTRIYALQSWCRNITILIVLSGIPYVLAMKIFLVICVM